jgi:hypothetical protein
LIGELLNEVLDGDEASSDPHLYLVSLFDLEIDPLAAEMVDSLRLSQKHDFDVGLALRVQELTQHLIEVVVLPADVHNFILGEYLIVPRHLANFIFVHLQLSHQTLNLVLVPIRLLFVLAIESLKVFAFGDQLDLDVLGFINLFL